MERFKR